MRQGGADCGLDMDNGQTANWPPRDSGRGPKVGMKESSTMAIVNPTDQSLTLHGIESGSRSVAFPSARLAGLSAVPPRIPTRQVPYASAKRFLDVALAIFVLILAFPVLL